MIFCAASGGHTWPGGAPMPALGETDRALDATALILDFFFRHQREQPL